MNVDDILLGGHVGDPDQHYSFLLEFANRHGLISGATGSGKTVTLQVLAEGFSRAGIPVFLADVKGDLAGLAVAGQIIPALHERCDRLGFSPAGFRSSPVAFWDIFARDGHAVRLTLSDMGPLLLSRLLDLSEAQEGVINIAFRLANLCDTELVGLADLRILLAWMLENSKLLAATYGSVPGASVSAIQRRLIILENQGGDILFGGPVFDLGHMMRQNTSGFGYINILAAENLISSPRLYATFLFWLLSKLFSTLPEIGDQDRPRFVFFFDEAHLLFKDAPPALINTVEQVVRLIRSKGVGVYFATQNPGDIPADILNQLANRFLHGLRGYTPRDQKLLRAAAETCRPNPNFDTVAAIRDAELGEAVVSTVEKNGEPGIAEKVLIRPPASHAGTIEPAERAAIIGASDIQLLPAWPRNAGRSAKDWNTRLMSLFPEGPVEAVQPVERARLTLPRSGSEPFLPLVSSTTKNERKRLLRDAVRSRAADFGEKVARQLLQWRNRG